MTDQPKDTAERLVEHLFRNGNGDTADRLVLTRDSDGADLGGWCRQAVADRVRQEQDADGVAGRVLDWLEESGPIHVGPAKSRQHKRRVIADLIRQGRGDA